MHILQYLGLWSPSSQMPRGLEALLHLLSLSTLAQDLLCESFQKTVFDGMGVEG